MTLIKAFKKYVMKVNSFSLLRKRRHKQIKTNSEQIVTSPAEQNKLGEQS